MKRMLLALFVMSCGGDTVGVQAAFVLPQAFRASEIKSYELYVVPASELADSGARTCEKFFANELGAIENKGGAYGKSAFDSTTGDSSTLDIKVRPGKGYVVLAQGWNVDLVANPNASPAQVIAVGCVPDVVVNGSKTTSFTLALCVCATPAPGDTSTACKNPVCPAL